MDIVVKTIAEITLLVWSGVGFAFGDISLGEFIIILLIIVMGEKYQNE